MELYISREGRGDDRTAQYIPLVSLQGYISCPLAGSGTNLSDVQMLQWYTTTTHEKKPEPDTYLLNFCKMVMQPYIAIYWCPYLIPYSVYMEVSWFWSRLNGPAVIQRVCPTEAVPTQARGRVRTNLQRGQRYSRIRFKGKLIFWTPVCGVSSPAEPLSPSVILY